MKDHTVMWLRIPVAPVDDSCIILITCWLHVKVALINNDQATEYTAQSPQEETLHSISCPVIKARMPQWQLESHLLSICTSETPTTPATFSLLKCTPSQYPLRTLPILAQLMWSKAADGDVWGRTKPVFLYGGVRKGGEKKLLLLSVLNSTTL